jgi:hypothetical protein
MGAYDRRAVLGLAESGYDNNKSDTASAAHGWHGLITLRTTRSVTAEVLALPTPPSQPWCHSDTFCRRPRRRQWPPIRRATRGNKRQRMDVRVRHTAGAVRSGGKVAWGCSARRTRPDGRRTSLVCKDRRATARPMVTGDRRCWAVELFSKCVKPHRGCAEVPPQGFDAVSAHVPGVSCAYILWHLSPPGLSPGAQRSGDKQRALQQGLAAQEKRHILQQWTQMGGVQRYKDELRQALAGHGGLGRQIECGSQGIECRFRAIFKYKQAFPPIPLDSVAMLSVAS